MYYFIFLHVVSLLWIVSNALGPENHINFNLKNTEFIQLPHVSGCSQRPDLVAAQSCQWPGFQIWICRPRILFPSSLSLNNTCQMGFLAYRRESYLWISTLTICRPSCQKTQHILCLWVAGLYYLQKWKHFCLGGNKKRCSYWYFVLKNRAWIFLETWKKKKPLFYSISEGVSSSVYWQNWRRDQSPWLLS